MSDTGMDIGRRIKARRIAEASRAAFDEFMESPIGGNV